MSGCDFRVGRLLDFDARVYDPSVGRFWQVDPLADAPLNIPGNPYHYTWNNPLKFIDPDGRHGQWIDNGDGSYVAEPGDGAWTLARDAGITFERAKEILASTLNESSSLGTMGVYVDPVDNVEKSAVDPGDVVVVPEQVTAHIENKNAIEGLQEQISNTSDALESVDQQIGSTNNQLEGKRRQIDATAKGRDMGPDNSDNMSRINWEYAHGKNIQMLTSDSMKLSREKRPSQE